MAVGNMPWGTTKLAKGFQGCTSPPKMPSLPGLDRTMTMRLKGRSLSQLPEDERLFFLTGRRPKLVRKRSMFGKLPSDIPQGCFAVYVGMERKRYVISTSFLSHSLFKQLLEKSEEEYGFEYEGGLNVACETGLFEHLLWLIITKDPAAGNLRLQDVIDAFYDMPF